MSITLDIGGEGRHPDAWNLNRSRYKTLGADRGGPIGRLIVGRGDAIPLADRSVERIIIERTPLSAAVVREIARVVAPRGTVELQHVPRAGRDRHRLACEILGGRARRAIRRQGGVMMQETTIVIDERLAAAGGQ